MSVVCTLGIPDGHRQDIVVLCDKMFKIFWVVPILKKEELYFQILKPRLHAHSSSFIFSK